MPILDIQRKGQQIGRIRLGQQVQVRDSEKMRPAKLDTFRFTTQSGNAANAIAALYGGTVRDWNGEYEVITREKAINVMVPPRDEVISQWWEMWTAGGCQRRCDGQREQIGGTACLCPRASDPRDEKQVAAARAEHAAMAARSTPAACKMVTRVNVMIPDLPGLGVFRLDTGSFYAAAEMGDTAEIMHKAREQGIFLPAVLRIEQRKRVAGGQTKNYPVPVLEIIATLRQITSGALEAGGITAQLPPAPGEQPKAITAGSPAAASAQRPAPIRAPAAVPAGDADAASLRAQQIYETALAAVTRQDVRTQIEAAKAEGLGDYVVCTDRRNDVWEDLRAVLTVLYEAAPWAGAA